MSEETQSNDFELQVLDWMASIDERLLQVETSIQRIADAVQADRVRDAIERKRLSSEPPSMHLEEP